MGNPLLATTSDIKRTTATWPGRFTVVHVGPSQERFVIKTDCIGHPLFQALLDQAELAYGFASNDPLQLPCDVDLFQKVMCEMEKEMAAVTASGAGFCKCYSAGSCHQLLISSSRLIVAGGF
ncbi:auxin-responsive protein SAUR71-like [Zingiber officinale]|uniref:auxin-responsive protein SAUR71-like n=1 Tax=Zingiber officinale TaxID=94328 RepID=UPI001C4AECF6|nr:auxin-responsive protein SAUR71-like [Zingiber officinale]